LYRKSIQLNHEFIADAAVLNGSNDVKSYQYLLLGKIANVQSLSITSQFNYSVTKKRLIMMSKTTSTVAAMLARLAIIPVMAIAFILFCTKTDAQQQPETAAKQAVKPAQRKVSNSPTKQRSAKPPVLFSFGDYPHTKNGAPEALVTAYKNITAKYEEEPGNSILHPGKITQEDKDKMEVMFKQMSLEQQQGQSIMFYYPPDPSAPKRPTQKQLDTWRDPKFCGLWIDDKKVANSDLANYKPEDFDLTMVSRLMKNAINYKNYHYQVDLMTVASYKKYRDDAIANRHKSQMSFRMLNRHFNKG
jgi:bla regulator protein BlaR1